MTLSHWFTATISGGAETIKSIQNLSLQSVEQNYVLILLLLALQGGYFAMLIKTYLKTRPWQGIWKQDRYADARESKPVAELLDGCTDFVLGRSSMWESIAFTNPIHGQVVRRRLAKLEGWGACSLTQT